MNGWKECVVEEKRCQGGPLAVSVCNQVGCLSKIKNYVDCLDGRCETIHQEQEG